MKILLVVVTAVLLSGCNLKKPEEYLGDYPSVWERIEDEKVLLTIEQNGADYTAEFYGASDIDSTLEKRIYPAHAKEGVLTITHQKGVIPVTYDKKDKSLSLTISEWEGQHRFKKLSREQATARVARMDKLMALRKPMTCELSGTATLIKNYGDLPRGDLLDVSLQLNFTGKVGVISTQRPATASGKMRVSHANGSSLESHVTDVQTWDRKTSKSSFETRFLGPYIKGNIGGISGPALDDRGLGWRPGIQFSGDPAGTELDGRYPVSQEDWDLLSKRTLTLPDPLNENSITRVARFNEMTVQCEYKAEDSQ